MRASYKEEIKELLNRFIEKYNQKKTYQSMSLVEASRETSKADFIIYQQYSDFEYPWLYVRCEFTKKATTEDKKRWFDEIGKPNAIVIYREADSEDKVVFDKFAGERPLHDWFKITLEGSWP